jgi:hypothetical protein
VNSAEASTLIVAMRDMRDDLCLDSIAVVVNTANGKLKLTLCVGAPLVIEDMNGNSIVGDVIG